jgi:retron-type reverse transcriptase
MSKISVDKGLDYSRYADDITFSGESRSDIEYMVSKCRELLSAEGFNLKDKKSRVASKHASQRVTGLVVNEKVQPPREYRRKLRAIFNNALINPQEYVDRLDELYGYFGYLSSFDGARNARQIRKDRIAIYRVSRLARIKKSKDE